MRRDRLFLKGLGFVYLIAFVSLAVQVNGLIGPHGILPANVYLAELRKAFGVSSYRLVPTIFWLGSSEPFLVGACIAGAVSAVFIIFGVFWRAALLAAFLIYLSFVSASQEFLSYQWDSLLLETGFLAIFLGTSPVVVWLFRWLLFRLVFLSGAVKLLSGDESWRHLTALTFHYQTQPIPTPLAWYAHRLPAWFQHGSAVAMFLIELPIALLVLGPRRARLFAAWSIVSLQILIMLTGNYAFFNLLTVALCLFLLDDERTVSIFPAGWRNRVLAVALTLLIGVLSGLLMYTTLIGPLPHAAKQIVAATAPFEIVNSYGLFAVMTTIRPEIVVEGSRDGREWQEYDFKYKAGQLSRPPPWVAPHQPRLDWQMWFAALESYRQNAWFLNFLARLLEGRPEVLHLMERNPFPDSPPQFIRAMLYEYRFSDSKTHSQWWTRTPLSTYVPAISLKDLSRHEASDPSSRR